MNKTLFVGCLLIFTALSCTKTVDEYAAIAFLIGDVKKNGTPAGIGDTVKTNDRIITGRHSSCDIKIGESIIRIKEKSTVNILQLLNRNNLENTELGLDMGKMLCKPKKLIKSESFLVKTPTAVAGVRGTKFIVEADRKKTTRIKVYDGKVKVVKRIRRLEKKIGEILDISVPVEEKEKVVITSDDVEKVSRKVDRLLKKEGNSVNDNAVIKVVERIKKDLVVTSKDIKPFRIEDFTNEKKELITVEEKSRDVIRKIHKVVKLEKKRPRPDGRLLITRYEVYFIKNGKVLWEGRVINPPVHHDDKLYIASGDYVFCASTEGSVLWRKNIVNAEKLEIQGSKLLVHTPISKRILDLKTGQE